MKTQHINFLDNLVGKTYNAPITEVNETVEVHYNKRNKTFSAAELWYIQRQHKSLSLRRRA